MNCCVSSDYMMRYFDGDDNEIETAQLKQHIKLCSKCREDFEIMKSTFDFLKNDNAVQPPANFEQAVMSRITDWKECSDRKKADRFLITLYCITGVMLIAFSALLMSGLTFISLKLLIPRIIEKLPPVDVTLTVLGTISAVAAISPGLLALALKLYAFAAQFKHSRAAGQN